MTRMKDQELDTVDGVTYCWQGKPFTGIGYGLRPDGTLAWETNYENGVMNGLAREWYPSGQLKSEVFYCEEDNSEPDREWDKDGQLRRETFLEYGFRVRERKWDEVGRLVEDYVIGPEHPNYNLLQNFRAAYDKRL